MLLYIENLYGEKEKRNPFIQAHIEMDVAIKIRDSEIIS